MPRFRTKLTASLALATMLSACGGEGSGSGGNTGVGPSPTPTPTPTAACSLRARQDWVAGQMREWYLFPETLPVNLDPTPFASVPDYLNALTATARDQGRDKFFTFLTSIAEENAFFNSGSTAGFGIRLSFDRVAGTVFVVESFEGAPAVTAGFDRGTEILAIGTTEANLRNVSDIFTAEGDAGITAALGPSDPGVARVFRITDANGTRTVSVTKQNYELTPVSSRFGVRIINDGGRRIGYLNLRTFIDTADPALRAAFSRFRTQGVNEFIVDFRYNGGGLVSIANLMGDLLGGNRSASDVYSYTTYRPEKSSNNVTRNFLRAGQSVAPVRIAFIGTAGTASASELVINSFIPYYSNRLALIGTNTSGKPVGQIALDMAACDDRLRVVAFELENRDRQGDYFDGLSQNVEASCQALDDFTRPLGDPQEDSVAKALDFLAGRACTPIGGAAKAAAKRRGGQALLTPDAPSAAQREVPGSF